MRNILLATMITLLSGCGWQLRDAQVVPQSIGILHIATQLADRDFVSELTRALDVYGVEVVTSAAAADYSVVIVDFRQNRFVGTLNASGRVAEYQLNEDVDFLIANASGTPLTNLFTASVERHYEIEERDLLSSENEERLIKQEMRQEIVRQILNRLKVLPSQSGTAEGSEASQQEAAEAIQLEVAEAIQLEAAKALEPIEN
jgi:LPS-assembly lipoprotein